jgi:hypothetical protein
MQAKRELFSRLNTAGIGDSNDIINIGCIEALEFENQVTLVAESNFTNIKHILVISKTGVISIPKDQTVDMGFMKRFTFSLFLGLLNLTDSLYLLFVDRVRAFRFERHLVFEINSIVAYNLNTLLPEIELSDHLSKLFVSSAYFSYSLDLSNSEEYKNVLQASPPQMSPNLFFVNNLNAIEYCMGIVDRGWLVPVIFGQISKILNPKFVMYIVYKESLLDFNLKIQEDICLLSNFFCPTSLRVVDIILVKQASIKYSIRIILNNFPGIIMKSEKKANVYEGLNYNSNRVYRYYQFFNEFFNCSQFIISGSSDLIQIMKKLNKFLDLQMDTNEHLNIEKLIPLIHQSNIKPIIESLSILLNSHIEERHSPESETPNFFCFSLCTEARFNKIFEIVSFIIKKLFIGKTEGNNSEMLSLFQEGTNGEQKFLSHVSNFLLNSNELTGKIEKLNKISVKKNKALSSYGTFSGILAEFYGSKKLITRIYDKIIKKRNLAVFNYHEIQLSVITHNCSGETPKEAFELGYANNKEILQSDLLVICLQEIIEMKSKNIKSILYNYNGDTENIWTDILKRFFPDFYFVGKVSLVGLMVAILINKKCKSFLELSLEKHKSDKLGFMKLLANKGSIFLDLKVNYEKVTISNSHLDAGNSEKQHLSRIDQLKNIINIYKTKKSANVGFIVGDMNFRLNLNPFDVQYLIEECIHNPQRSEITVNELLKGDKFTQMLAYQTDDISDVFEFPIKFLPSYKKFPGTKEYNFEKQIPSWLDYED